MQIAVILAIVSVLLLLATVALVAQHFAHPSAELKAQYMAADTVSAVKRSAIPGLASGCLGTLPSRSNSALSCVTWVITDIEGSTRLWETCPRSTKAALDLHDALIRKLLADYHGYVKCCLWGL